MLEYLPQYKPNCFVESWVHTEIFQKRLWVTNFILLVVALFAYDYVKSGAENKALYLQRGLFSLVTGCTSSTIGDYSISYLSKTQIILRAPETF